MPPTTAASRGDASFAASHPHRRPLHAQNRCSLADAGSAKSWYTLDLRRLRRTAAGLPFGAWAADMDRLSPGLRERLGAAAADYLSGPAALAHSCSHVRVRA